MSDTTGSADLGSDTATSSVPPGRRGLIRSIIHRIAGEEVALPVEGRLPSFEGATGWLNSDPLTPDDLRGRRTRRLLDLHLRQLAAHAPVPAGLGS